MPPALSDVEVEKLAVEADQIAWTCLVEAVKRYHKETGALPGANHVGTLFAEVWDDALALARVINRDLDQIGKEAA